MRHKTFSSGVAVGTTLTILAAVLISSTLRESEKAESISPTLQPEKEGFSPLLDGDREVYYPGTETLAPDEMRVVACGTGMPNARPKQAAVCFLVELGNGDQFIFDCGTGCAERISAMNIPYDYLDKVFLGHLHADHIGDLDALWIGGVISNRQKPLRVWGPSGPKPEFGTTYKASK